MKVRLEFGSRNIDVDVRSQEEIARQGCPIVAVPFRHARLPLDESYVLGTKSGFACMLCNTDCILAPSGQQQHAMGNPVMCMDCFVATRKGQS